MLNLIIKTLIMYFLMMLAIRVMGKRQIGDMQPGELTVTILVSELAARPIGIEETGLLEGIIPLAVLVITEFMISKILLKSILVRRIINGHSAIVIRDGKIDQTLLKKLRITVDDLMEILRGQNVFDFTTVAYGILETNGTLSILPKTAYQPAEKGDVGAKTPSAAMPIAIITDGILRDDEVAFTHISRKKLENFLRDNKLSVKDIFLLTADSSGKIEYIKKEKKGIFYRNR